MKTYFLNYTSNRLLFVRHNEKELKYKDIIAEDGIRYIVKEAFIKDNEQRVNVSALR